MRKPPACHAGWPTTFARVQAAAAAASMLRTTSYMQTVAWLLLCCAVSGGYAASRICERSSYCSMDQAASMGYVGPLDTNEQLLSMLQKGSYKKEIIITSEGRLDTAVQTLSHFYKAGYAHVVIVMTHGQRQCTRLQALFPHVQCTWYTSLKGPEELHLKWFPHSSRINIIWAKYITGARMVKAGYNTMIVDSDSAVLDDWYYHVKRPPFARVHIVNQRESWRACNGGFTYVQNAAPNGPVAWALFDQSFRAVRLMENSSRLIPFGVHDKAVGFFRRDDQEMYHDAIHSTIVGRPYFYTLLGLKDHAPNWNTPELNHGMWAAEAQDQLFEKLFGSMYPYKDEFVNVTKEEEAMVGAPSYLFTVGVMKMPHTGGEWPVQHYGGQVYSDELGPVAKEYLQWFKDIGTPMWPDPEDPATAEAAKATPAEFFSFAPNFMVPTWHSDAHAGADGWWHSHLLPTPRGVMAHTWAMADKILAWGISGHYDWKLSAQLHGGALSGYKATHQLQAGDGPLLVVGYMPGLFSANTTLVEYAAALVELAKVAMIIGRAVGWPSIPCSIPWLQRTDALHDPITYGHKIPWGDYLNKTKCWPFGDSLQSLQCVWNPLNCDGCVQGQHVKADSALVGRALLPHEFYHFHTNLYPAGTQLPPDSFIRIEQPDGLVTALELTQQTVSMEVHQVVWLNKVPKVAWLDKAEHHGLVNWREQCCALQAPGRYSERCASLSTS